MKTFLKVLGTAAVLATIIPFSHKKDEESGQETYEALLWKAVSRPDPEAENKRKLETFSIGFRCPFGKDSEEAHLFADELTVNYHTAPAAGGAAAEEAALEHAHEEEAAAEEAALERAHEEEAAAEEAAAEHAHEAE